MFQPNSFQKSTSGWSPFTLGGRRKYLNWPEHDDFLSATAHFAPTIRIFCHFLAFSGVRISEALEVCGYHVSKGEVVIRTLKRRKDIYRVIQLPTQLTAEMLALLPDGDLSQRVFPFSRTTGYRMVKLLMGLAAISGPAACPKGLRHSYAVRNLGRGVPITKVQEWLGHASLVSTQVYTQVSGEEDRAFARLSWRYGT